MRKIIQLLAYNESKYIGHSILGLCNDGTIWKRESRGGKLKWVRLINDIPPQDGYVKEEK